MTDQQRRPCNPLMAVLASWLMGCARLTLTLPNPNGNASVSCLHMHPSVLVLNWVPLFRAPS